MTGQFDHRSVVDVIAALDDIVARSKSADPVLPWLVEQHAPDSAFWQGLVRPQSPRDHRSDTL